MTKAEIAQRYGSASNYLKDYAQAIDRLIAAGYLLRSRRAPLLAQASAHYAAAMAGQ